MKAKLFFIAGVVCFAVTAYEFYARNSLWVTTINGTSGTNRKKYMGLRNVFIERYEAANIYHLTNINAVTRISILLGVMSVEFFILTLLYTKDVHDKSETIILKKVVIALLIISSCVITFLNQWAFV